MFVIGVSRAIVRDKVCADDGGRDDDEKGLDQEDCEEPETVVGDALGGDERSTTEGEEGADEEGG